MKARIRKRIHELVDFIINGKQEESSRSQYSQLDVLRFAIALDNDDLFRQLCEWHDQETIQNMLEESQSQKMEWFQELFFAKWVELSGYSGKQLVEGVAILRQQDVSPPEDVKVMTAEDFPKEQGYEEVETKTLEFDVAEIVEESEEIVIDMTEEPDSSEDYWDDLNDDLEFGDDDE